MEYLLKAAFAFFDILMLIIFVVIGMFNLFNGNPDRSLVFELFYLEFLSRLPFFFVYGLLRKFFTRRQIVAVPPNPTN